MKILMIYPQLDSPLGTNHGISAIAGVLHANGHQMELLHISEKYKGVLSPAAVIQHIEEAGDFGIIGFSAMSQQYEYIASLSAAIRERFPDLVQIIGGVHCTMVPTEVHEGKLFDYVCVGEGEYSLLQLMDALENGKPTEEIPNMRMWRDDQPIVNKVAPFPDLDTMPPP